MLANIIRNVVGSDKFIVITGPDLYSRSGTDALVEFATSNASAQMQIIKRYNMIESTTVENTININQLEADLLDIKARKCNVVAVFAQASHYTALFETAARLGLYGAHKINWVVSETFPQYFLQYKSSMSANVQQTISGAFMANVENGKNLDSSLSRYPHLNRLWKQQAPTGKSDGKVSDAATACSEQTDDLGNFVWQTDHDLDPATPSRCTGFNYQENSVVEYGSYPPFAYDAMWTAAHALHTLLYTNNGANFSDSFPTIGDRVKFFDTITKTNFVGASGTVKFFADGDRSTKEIFYNILQVHTLDGEHGQALVSIGSFSNNTFVKNDNFLDDFGISNIAICKEGYSEDDVSKGKSTKAVMIEVLLSLGFLAFLSMTVMINYYKHKHKEKILNREIKSRRTSCMEKSRRVKLLKRELRMKLIEELIVQIGVGSIEIADLVTDWVAYGEDSLDENEVVHSMYYLAMLVASVCSAGAIYFRIDNTRQILHHYRHGVKEIKLSKDIIEKAQELETFLSDKIDPPEYLIDKYGRRKARLIGPYLWVCWRIYPSLFSTLSRPLRPW